MKSVKDVRIKWRQYNTSDMVGADMRKHSGWLPGCRGGVNMRTDV